MHKIMAEHEQKRKDNAAALADKSSGKTGASTAR